MERLRGREAVRFADCTLPRRVLEQKQNITHTEQMPL